MIPKKIFEPIRIRGLEIPNRIARTAHSTHYSYERVTDDFIAYHTARAKGGCGLSILEAASVHSSSMLLRISWDIEGYKRLMDSVRPHGMRIFQQLWHAGHHTPGRDGIAWGPSDVPSPWGHTPVPMTKRRIDEVVQSFADAAGRCREGGLDGVQIHAAHGYLVHQFLSPLTNKREDEYGGSLENRMRFLVEVLRAVRAAVGNDYPVGVRLSASQAPGSVTEDDHRFIAPHLEAEDLVDYIDASFGDYYRMLSMNDAMQVPSGYELPSSGQITGAYRKVPRIVTGRFRTLQEAEQVLSDGIADIVSLVRAQIADPDLVRKTREGRADEVRPCIACNQGCIGGLFRADRMGCLVNPAVGFEDALSDDLVKPVEKPRRVLIIGGGPAGMEAARVARLAGHDVSLVEATPDLGGSINLARKAPYLHTIGDITAWLEQEVYRLGVDVRLSTFADEEFLASETFDDLVIATGAMPRMDGVQSESPWAPAQGVEQSHVISPVELFGDPFPKGIATALVLDDRGQYEAIAVVDELLKRGVAVTLATRFTHMTPSAEFTQRTAAARERFAGKPFRLVTRARLESIGKDSCVITGLEAGPSETVPADMVVLITPGRPALEPFGGALGTRPEAIRIGDAHAPRDLQAAIADGRMIGLKLAGVLPA